MRLFIHTLSLCLDFRANKGLHHTHPPSPPSPGAGAGRRQVALGAGRGLMDWIRLKNKKGADMSQGAPPDHKITPEMLAEHAVRYAKGGEEGAASKDTGTSTDGGRSTRPRARGAPRPRARGVPRPRALEATRPARTVPGPSLTPPLSPHRARTATFGWPSAGSCTT